MDKSGLPRRFQGFRQTPPVDWTWGRPPGRAGVPARSCRCRQRRALNGPTTPKPDCDYGRQYRVKAGKRALTRHYRPCSGFVSGLRGGGWVGRRSCRQRVEHTGEAPAKRRYDFAGTLPGWAGEVSRRAGPRQSRFCSSEADLSEEAARVRMSAPMPGSACSLTGVRGGRCCGVLNDSFRAWEVLNESFKTSGERPIREPGGTLPAPRERVGDAVKPDRSAGRRLSGRHERLFPVVGPGSTGECAGWGYVVNGQMPSDLG